MSDTNIVVLKGRLTRSAELKHTAAGAACTSFSLAVNETRGKGNGEYDSRPNFFDVTIWGNYGAAVAKYLTKGREVLVTGRLRQDRWESEGKKNAKVQIIAEKLELLREPKNSGGKTTAGAPEAAEEYDAPGDYAESPDSDPFN